jgi:dihydrofolate reductase
MPGTRRLVVTENITANGVIEFTDDWFDPADQDDIDDLLQVMQAQMAAEEALVLGRRTFEDFRGYWPLQADDTTGSTAHLNRVQKYVVSSTMADPAWANSTPTSSTSTSCSSTRSSAAAAATSCPRGSRCRR